jgi:hypothetical protein
VVYQITLFFQKTAKQQTPQKVEQSKIFSSSFSIITILKANCGSWANAIMNPADSKIENLDFLR